MVVTRRRYARQGTKRKVLDVKLSARSTYVAGLSAGMRRERVTPQKRKKERKKERKKYIRRSIETYVRNVADGRSRSCNLADSRHRGR